MIDELREEAIVNKVGGRFKLSTLIQKRLVAINAGARPLVDAAKLPNKMEVVIQEIMQDKIYLDAQMNVQVTGAATGGLPERRLPHAVGAKHSSRRVGRVKRVPPSSTDARRRIGGTRFTRPTLPRLGPHC